MPEPPQRARRALVRPEERVVEAAEAGEARRERDLRHREVRLVDEPLREVEPPRLGHGERRRPDVRHEQAVELARTDPQPRGERVDRARVERAVVDERERAADDGGRAEPRRGARGGLGRQRRHGRKPASAAAAAVGK